MANGEARSHKTETATPNPLATEIQRDSELAALRIVASAVVRAAKADVRHTLADDPLAATPDGAALLDRAVDFWALSLAMREVIGDPLRPAFNWPIEDTPRDWLGHHFPGASVGGVANPDNIYRNAFLDGSRRYAVRGKRHPNGPTSFSLELASQSPGQFMLAPAGGKLEADLGDQLGILTQREIVLDDDGVFRVTLGPEPADGLRNHLQTKPGPLALNHRDTLDDWRQVPNALEIELLGAEPDTPPLDEAELIRRTAADLPGYVAFWTPFRRQFLGAPPPNSVSPVFPRDGGWGYAAGGRFALAEEEALVIVTRAEGARYTGFQIADCWMMVPDARRRQVSLNNSQRTPDADGTITYVICRRDPGVANWIDTGGQSEGWFMLRWQECPAATDAGRLLVHATTSRLSELDTLLGAGVARSDAVARRAQLARRSADWARRIGQ